MDIKAILMFLLEFYLLSVSACLLMDLLTTARSQYYGIPLGKHALSVAIETSIVPVMNLLVAWINFTILLDKRDRFIIKFMYTRDRLNELKFIDEEEEEEEEDDRKA